MRLGQRAHDARELDRARAATGADRFERPPVEVSYRAVVDEGSQGQDGTAGPRGRQQPPDSRHRHALSARSAASRLRDGIAASSAASARPYPLAPTHSPIADLKNRHPRVVVKPVAVAADRQPPQPGKLPGRLLNTSRHRGRHDVLLTTDGEQDPSAVWLPAVSAGAARSTAERL